ncbi:beta-carboxysome assembly chaperone CcmS [Baaleninema sp.]|uniref:beta-carboxysome assembly chaperone CcmS n=1 Tax=Baaleninema sp. TaxID=3101197 RepID=UPI003D035E4A
MRPGTPPQNTEDRKWREQLDRFVKANTIEIAALAWDLHQRNPDSHEYLGIDIAPKPHFITCTREALATLNQKVDNRLREMMGVVDNHNPEIEVLLIAIGNGQIQAVQYQPQPTPPECFEETDADIDTLIDRLEQRMGAQIEP